MSKSNRIKYGFTLEFPAKPFTVRSLSGHGAHPSYITARVRVLNAIKAGIVAVVGAKQPMKKDKNGVMVPFKRRGRKELLYVRTDAEASLTGVQNISAKV